MDPLSGLLESPRAREAFVLRSSLDAPWSIRIEDHAPVTFVAVTRGGGWLRPAAGAPRRLEVGDVAVVRGPDVYTVSDTADRPAQVVIDEQQQCRPAPGRRKNPMGPQGIRAWGNSPDGATILLTGTYRSQPEVTRRLLAALPAVLVVPGDPALLALLVAEARRESPGQDAVLDRLVDVLLIATLRSWFARPEAASPGWLRASGDPLVAPALALMHDTPQQPWTIGALAGRVGVSRATLARRFTDLVGQSPIGYLTEHRLDLAADLLAEGELTLEAIARRVGYSDAFALSTAFKRVRGMSPRAYRAAVNV